MKDRYKVCGVWLSLFIIIVFTPFAISQNVLSDVDPLRTVLVLEPGQDLAATSYAFYDELGLAAPIYVDGMVQQHQELVQILRQNGVHVLDLKDVLNGAIANARKAGKLEESLAEIFPEQYPRLKPKLDQLNAAILLGRSSDFFYNKSDKGYFDSLVPSSPGFTYTRDFAVATPSGIILTNSREKHRIHEHRLGRFIFQYADEFKNDPIVFDAEKEGVRCEGGDMIVKDAKTLLMGINNLSDREAAQKIAQKLNMDVIAVSMPPVTAFNGANVEILHLDTVFNLVDKNKALTVPYFFFKKYDHDNPVITFLRSIENRPKEKPPKGELAIPLSLKGAISSIQKVGWLTHFAAGSGKATEMGEKLGDYLEQQGYEIIPVGGEQNGINEDQYINEHVFYELSLQAANVVQLGPGKVIAYAHNKFTNEALRAKGVRVLTFDGKYLADGLGGPHCLTMPLVRN